jgi:hypothetical protein
MRLDRGHSQSVEPDRVVTSARVDGVAGLRTDEAVPREVVGFEVILGAYSPLSMAAMRSVSRSGYNSAMEPSER